MSVTGPCPDTRTLLSWKLRSICKGLWESMTCSGAIYREREVTYFIQSHCCVSIQPIFIYKLISNKISFNIRINSIRTVCPPVSVPFHLSVLPGPLGHETADRPCVVEDSFRHWWQRQQETGSCCFRPAASWKRDVPQGSQNRRGPERRPHQRGRRPDETKLRLSLVDVWKVVRILRITSPTSWNKDLTAQMNTNNHFLICYILSFSLQCAGSKVKLTACISLLMLNTL